jgi:hypothetical protein
VARRSGLRGRARRAAGGEALGTATPSGRSRPSTDAMLSSTAAVLALGYDGA